MTRVVHEPINPQGIVAEVESPSAGAIVTFAGVVRNHHAGQTVKAIDYHAYESMAERELARIEGEVTSRWPGVGIRIVHRVGFLEIGETSVFIAVASPHRAEGFEASRYAIDRIKETVPIWKKEIYPDGHAWIEGS